MPQRLAAVRTVIYPASATPGRVAVYCDRSFGRNKLRTSRMGSRHLGGGGASRPRRAAWGGPRSRAAANWESRLPGGAFPPRPN